MLQDGPGASGQRQKPHTIRGCCLLVYFRKGYVFFLTANGQAANWAGFDSIGVSVRTNAIARRQKIAFF
jgi:hypothetical protein